MKEKKQQQSISHKEPETSNLEHVFKSRSWLSTEVSYSEMALGSERQVCWVSFTRTGLYHLLQGQRDSSQTIYFPPKDE